MTLVLKKLLTPVISIKEMPLKKPFGVVLSILQSWEFSKIPPQNPGNTISETLDYKNFRERHALEFLVVFGARPSHFEKASAWPENILDFLNAYWVLGKMLVVTVLKSTLRLAYVEVHFLTGNRESSISSLCSCLLKQIRVVSIARFLLRNSHV